MLSPCKCDGSVKWVHATCLDKWIGISNKHSCPQCNYIYKTELTCNYPRLSFLSIERNIKIFSVFILFTLVLTIGFLKYLIHGNYKSKINFIFDGIKGLILFSVIVIPYMNYKGWINFNNIMNNSVFIGSSTLDIMGVIYLVLTDLLRDLIKKKIIFNTTFINYNV